MFTLWWRVIRQPPRREQKERKTLVPNSIRIPVSYEYIFPNGALLLGVDKVVDFTKVREGNRPTGVHATQGIR